jgi:SAM-dependent methyltransferase
MSVQDAKLKLVPKLSKDECLHCGSIKINHIHDLPFGKVYRCGNCEYAFTIFDNEEFPYQVEEMWGADGFIKTRLYLLSHNRERERARLRVLQRFIREGKLLEFGANIGSFLWVANQEGFKVSGTDLHNELLNVNHIEGMKFYHTDAMDCSFDDTFDVIAGFQFLEHVDNPLKFLKSLHEYLNPGGYLFFEIPNINSRYHTKHKAKWQHFNEGHFSHFNANSLKFVFQKAGYEVIYQECSHPTDFIVDPYYLPIRHSIWKFFRRLFAKGGKMTEVTDRKFKTVESMNLEDELEMINSTKAKVTQMERFFQKIAAFFVTPYAKYLGAKGQGDIIKIIAQKPQ